MFDSDEEKDVDMEAYEVQYRVYISKGVQTADEDYEMN